MRCGLLKAVVCLVAVSSLAHAASTYLNGVNIDGVTNQRFEKASVKIDEKGNVFIDAPGYAVKAVESSPPPRGSVRTADPAADAARLTKRYWLVTEQTVPGLTDFDIDIYVNSKWLRQIRSNEDQIIQEITKNLAAGKNSILLTARKKTLGVRKSVSPEHVFRVIIGEGNVGGDNVMIDNPLIRFERRASEPNDVSQEFTITVR
ncbi:MAG: hypothetical protein ACT4TC_12630 [Myxococcaceae bacterium]